MKLKRLAVGLLLGLGISVAPPAFSFQLEPISQTFAPQGSQSTRSYQISNGSDEPIAVEVSVMQREVNADGEETLSPAEENFIVYPTQILMDPLSLQTVRVTWVGDPEPEAELSYRLIAEQLPIQLQAKDATAEKPYQATASVELMMRYAGSLYIQPSNAAPDVVLDSAQLEQDEAGNRWLAVRIKNQGTARHIFRDPQLQLNASGASVTLANEELGAIHSRTILAGGERAFRIPWPMGLPEGDVTGQLILQMN